MTTKFRPQITATSTASRMFIPLTVRLNKKGLSGVPP
jgi:hypothetical protein